jgi:hypothetical protein
MLCTVYNGSFLVFETETALSRMRNSTSLNSETMLILRISQMYKAQLYMQNATYLSAPCKTLRSNWHRDTHSPRGILKTISCRLAVCTTSPSELPVFIWMLHPRSQGTGLNDLRLRRGGENPYFVSGSFPARASVRWQSSTQKMFAVVFRSLGQNLPSTQYDPSVT